MALQNLQLQLERHELVQRRETFLRRELTLEEEREARLRSRKHHRDVPDLSPGTTLESGQPRLTPPATGADADSSFALDDGVVDVGESE